MRATFSFPGRRTACSPHSHPARRSTCVILTMCALSLLSADLGAQKSKPKPAEPKLTLIASDQSSLALSPNFGGLVSFSVNQSGDLAFNGGYALFLRRAEADAPARILQIGDPAPGFPDARCDLVNGNFLNNAGHVALSADINSLSGVLSREIYLYDGSGFHRIAGSLDAAPGGGGRPLGRTVSVVGLNDADVVAISAPLVASPGGNQATMTTLYLATVDTTPTRVAGPGDPAPDTGGGTLDGLSGGQLNADGELLFTAQVVGGNGGRGVFVGSATGIRKVVSHGDPLPTPLNGTFDFSTSTPGVRFNNAGQAAFAYQNAIFVATPGSGLTVVAQPGMTVPAPISGTLINVALYAFNDAGQIAFNATFTGTNSPAVVRYTPEAPLEVVAYNRLPAPDTGGARFQWFNAASLAPDGTVTFFCAGLTGGTSPRGVFQSVPGSALRKIVAQGDPAPLNDGGQFGLQASNATVTLSGGDVAFQADVLDSPALWGVFLSHEGTISSLVSGEDPLPAGARVTLRTFGVGTDGSSAAFYASLAGGQASLWLSGLHSRGLVRIVADGDPIPGTAGRMVDNGTGGYVTMNSAGDIAFSARLIGGPGYGGNGIFIRSRAGSLSKIVAQGDTDTATGRTFTGISWNGSPQLSLTSSGQVLFYATLTGTSPNPTGVFVGKAGELPSTVVLAGSSMPFTGIRRAEINGSGLVAFSATTASGSGYWVADPGDEPQKVVATGDAGPGGSTFPVTMPPRFTFNDSGEITFLSGLYGGPGSGLFVATVADGPKPIALGGSSAAAGGSFALNPALPSFHSNNAGDVVFRSDLTGGSADSGLFLVRRSDGVLRAIALQGQSAPSMAGVFDTMVPSLNSVPGEGAFLTSDGAVWTSQRVALADRSVLVHYRFGTDNTLEKAFGRGDKAPQSDGGTLVGTIQTIPGTADAQDRLYFFATIVGGNISNAIYMTR